MLTRQWPYPCLTDRIIFFQSGFRPCTPVTISWFHRPDFFHFFLNQDLMKKNEKNPVCETVIWPLAYRIENLIEKKMKKNLVCETVIWSLANKVENLIERKMKKNWSVKLWYVHWRTGSKTWLKKKTRSYRPWYCHWRL